MELVPLSATGKSVCRAGSSGDLWKLAPTLDQKVGVRVGVLVGKADTVAQRQAAPVAAVDPDEGAWVSAEGDHLLEDRKEHQLSQRDLPPLGQLHELSLIHISEPTRPY